MSLHYLLYIPTITVGAQDQIKRILVTDTQKQLKRRAFAVGEGIDGVHTSGPHAWQKRILLRALSIKHIRSMEPIVRQTVQQLALTDDKGTKEIDMYPVAVAIVQKAFTRLLYGDHLGLSEAEMNQASQNLRTLVDNIYPHGIVVLYFRPLARVLRYFSSTMTCTLKAMDGIDSLQNRVLERWMETKDKESMDGLLFKLLTAAAEEVERPMPLNIVRDNMLSLTIGGVDSTASGVLFTLIALASHTEWQTKVREEIANAQTEHISDGLPILNAVVSESLRLYPPFPESFPRVVDTNGYTMSGYHLPRGVMVTCHLMALHRDPAYWSDADRFDPSRFMDTSSHSQWYLPFGAGPESCIGKKLALITIRTAVAEFVRLYSFSVTKPIETGTFYVTLAPQNNEAYFSISRI
ncbi:hypothetical protein EC973_008211 [Apophysomyces ossiformis]|uniref:Cytochrome P450 n=1 Tax=Apophysomyces ossiformis TaxID=679940 RepID=A0A8H7BT33_9FUNG|nr:hypothetical protein EC973_008211 [Apophysomyces ossiformis]